ncbi:MAG: hypothetical protein HXX14_21175 [Bacteroidetes bacterium]|nr:hypothetical protein [Bacteroidota bacterium]
MKALHKMDNLDRGELLCRLFPEEMANIQNAIKKQCDYFLQNETDFREGWYKSGFFTADFWYRLVQDAHKVIEKNEDRLLKKPRWFADHFFDGHNAIFAMHCLIEHAQADDCTPNLKQAIHLIFGNEPLLKITLNDK